MYHLTEGILFDNGGREIVVGYKLTDCVGVGVEVYHPEHVIFNIKPRTLKVCAVFIDIFMIEIFPFSHDSIRLL